MRFIQGVPRLHAPHGRAVSMLLAALLSTGVTNALDRTREGTARAADPLPPIVLQAPSGPVDPAPLQQTWVATSLTIQRLDLLDGATVSRFFGPTSFGLGGWGGSVPALAWASEAAFASDVANGRVPDGVRAVMYDPETWSATPVAEQQDPEAAMRAFAALARRHGYVVVITPHPGLVAAPGAGCSARPTETQQEAFLRCDLEGSAARYADVVEVQAQSLEADVGAYRAFVSKAARQARASNPGVLVISGLSTNFAMEPSTLFDAWQSVSDVVDGHYLNVPHGRRPRVAVGFLQSVIASTSPAPLVVDEGHVPLPASA